MSDTTLPAVPRTMTETESHTLLVITTPLLGIERDFALHSGRPAWNPATWLSVPRPLLPSSIFVDIVSDSPRELSFSGFPHPVTLSHAPLPRVRYNLRRLHDICPTMEPSFPHILNPQVSGFGPMLDNPDPLPQPQEPIGPIDPNSITDAAANGTRKRPISRIKSTYPRKRAIQACVKCRARRTKCNNERPACSSCLDLGVECSYSESDPSRYVSRLPMQPIASARCWSQVVNDLKLRCC